MHFSFANVFMLTGICGVIHEYFVCVCLTLNLLFARV